MPFERSERPANEAELEKIEERRDFLFSQLIHDFPDIAMETRTMSPEELEKTERWWAEESDRAKRGR